MTEEMFILFLRLLRPVVTFHGQIAAETSRSFVKGSMYALSLSPRNVFVVRSFEKLLHPNVLKWGLYSPVKPGKNALLAYIRI